MTLRAVEFASSKAAVKVLYPPWVCLGKLTVAELLDDSRIFTHLLWMFSLDFHILKFFFLAYWQEPVFERRIARHRTSSVALSRVHVFVFAAPLRFRESVAPSLHSLLLPKTWFEGGMWPPVKGLTLIGLFLSMRFVSIFLWNANDAQNYRNGRNGTPSENIYIIPVLWLLL